MQQIIPHIRAWILAVLCLLGGYNVSQAQVINGHFDQSTPPGGGCPAAVWAWVEGPVPGSIQWENRYDYGNWWLDITGCGWGNGRWIEQGVPTVIGQVYHLTFDLGCWNGQYHTDAGAILTVNGVPPLRVRLQSPWPGKNLTIALRPPLPLPPSALLPMVCLPMPAQPALRWPM
jgi:hypothetical protein